MPYIPDLKGMGFTAPTDNGPFSHITLTDNTTITYRWMESIKMLNYACAQKFLDIKTMNGMELTINIDQIRYIIDRG